MPVISASSALRAEWPSSAVIQLYAIEGKEAHLAPKLNESLLRILYEFLSN